jgi:predicted metalloprotease
VFNEGARLDPSQVEDRRGTRMGGMGRGAAIGVGGGGLGLVILVLAMLLGVNPGDLAGTGTSTGLDQLQNQTADRQLPTGSTLQTDCKTGADANRREDCRIVGFVNSIQSYWAEVFQQRGGGYEPAKTTFFSGGTQTGCGFASSQVGPFYCPNDNRVYIDLGFFNELRTKFGASGGPFAQGYVIAHEYGHHIQDLTGVLARTQGEQDTGPQSVAVRTELQADCYAGVWARHAVDTGYLQQLTQKDIADSLNAAAAVGDDRIQEAMQGRVNPERWTHGSSEQRQRWFTTGYQRGDPASCDTFRGQI